MAIVNVCKAVVWASLLSLMLSAAPVQGSSVRIPAGLKIPKTKVLLMATLNNGPAMQPVTWTIYRFENGVPVYNRSVNLHSANIELEPGFYRADVKLNAVGTTRSRSFDLSNVRSSNIIVAMD